MGSTAFPGFEAPKGFPTEDIDGFAARLVYVLAEKETMLLY